MPLDRAALPAGHEAGAVASAVDAAAGAEVDQLEAALGQPPVAAYRVAPVGVAAVGDDVAALEHGGQLLEEGVDRRAGRDVDEDRARRSQRRAQIFQAARLDNAGLEKLRTQPARIEPDHLHAPVARLQRQPAAHPPETDHAEIASRVIHGVPFLDSVPPALPRS